MKKLCKYPFEVALVLNWRLHCVKSKKGNPIYKCGSVTEMEYMASRIKEHKILSLHDEMRAKTLLHCYKADLKYLAEKPQERSKLKGTMCSRDAHEFKGMILLVGIFDKDYKAKDAKKLFKTLDGYKKGKYGFDWCKLTIENKHILLSNRWIVTAPTLDKIVKDKLNSIVLDESKLDKRLYDYQKECIKYLLAGFSLLADDMGLGKTAEVIQFIKYMNYKKCLFVVPSTLKINWKEELMIWGAANNKDEIQILSSRTPYPIKDVPFIIINYDVLFSWHKALKKYKWDIIIADECHAIQNMDAQRTGAFIKIAKTNYEHKNIMISGTPFTTRPIQLYSTLNLLAPQIFNDITNYGLMFCGPTRPMGILTFNGASNKNILHNILKDGIMIRRLKKDVLKELPSKRRLAIYMNTIENEKTAELEEKACNCKSQLGAWEYQKQIASYSKLDSVIAWIKNYLLTDQKLVVFAVHKDIVDQLMTALGKKYNAVKYVGDMNEKKKDAAKNKFMTDPTCKLFIGNTESAGKGLTLTAASDTCTIEFGSTISEHMQAEDRTLRIGQKAKTVVAYYLIAGGTIDELCMHVLNSKKTIQDSILDNTTDNLFKEIQKVKNEVLNES